MDSLLHRPLSLMLVLRVQAGRAMLFLDALRVGGLEGGDVDGVRVHERLGHGGDVGDEAVEEVQGHALADDDAEDFRLVFFGWEGVVCCLLVFCYCRCDERSHGKGVIDMEGAGCFGTYWE